MLSSPELPGTPQPDPTRAERSASERSPGLAEVSAFAKSLEPRDRTQLVADLWESLPPKNRAAIVAFGLERLHDSDGVRVPAITGKAAVRNGPTLWEILFDPRRTPGLYSAPRRFDLATIFVVTAAYSLLFGAMSVLNYGPLSFGPLDKVVVGALVTMVAVTQAFYQDRANPRGVSIVTGAVTLSLIVATLQAFDPRSFPAPFLIVVIFGLIGGAISGYLSGVLVGGVFLVADALRRFFARRSERSHENKAASDSEPANISESPWTN